MAGNVISKRVGAIVAAMLLAIDPLTVQWGGHVRMYALLQLMVVTLAWAFAVSHEMGSMAEPSRLSCFALAWAAVFTHVGASVVVMALLVSIIVVFRLDVLRRPALRALMIL